ncbi:hypothetical protein [Paludibaculum fermentans]|uniref:hypothetical protein n=1 Tax=Paludibaculum fermentans TaxID=1473598 RepID=UPI003EBA758D
MTEQQKEHDPHVVEIVIDRVEYKSPTQTTGAALYALGHVAAGYRLFRESPGPREDEPIANDQTQVKVHAHEKFYSSPGQITPGGADE